MYHDNLLVIIMVINDQILKITKPIFLVFLKILICF